jgi:two-component sensor histidine kinase
MGAMSIVGFIGVLRKYQDTFPGYLIAAIVFILAICLREAVDPYIRIPYVTLFPAMIICSLVGGRAAGILAAVVGGLVAWYLWLPPRGTFSLEWPTGQLTVSLYVLTSTILLLLTRGLNETLRALEKERDLSSELFRELQHRTANNLQSISAMLRQNRNAIKRDPAVAVEVIDTANRRFEIMSRINRRLYSPDMQEVDAATLLRDLCNDIIDASGSNHIVCHIRASSVKVSRERAMLLSLLVAELMLNASKPAFEIGQSGNIQIALETVGPDYRFSFTDDGKGFEPDAGAGSASGLGSRIMQGLVSQMRGTMRTVSGPSGTCVEVCMPASERPVIAQSGKP